MAIEIERKFLVSREKLPELQSGVTIKQAYIPTTNGSTVRIRLANEKAWIAIKTPAINLSRQEYEFVIPTDEALEILAEVCLEDCIEKCRYLFEYGGSTWEVDVFAGQNEGLIVAEVELDTEDQPILLPEWVSEEVTLDSRYSNYSLSRNPFKSWQ